MANPIPNSVIGTVSNVIADYYYSHTKIASLFMESGAPGDPPIGNVETKCMAWFRRCNDDPTIDALAVLGRVIQEFMDMDPAPYGRDKVRVGQPRIRESLARNQLTYQINGHVTQAGATATARTLADYLKAGDLASIEAEFARAIDQLDRDPHAAITAACSIIEATCKAYIETFNLAMPSNQSIAYVWKVVQAHLGLNPDPTLRDDQKRILGGLASVVDGIGAYRTHIGSAHGRGMAPPAIAISEARLAVNAAHTIVIFILELWNRPQPAARSKMPWEK